MIEHNGGPRTDRSDRTDVQKRAAAEAAAAEVQPGMVLGLGTGSTARWMIEAVGRRVRSGELTDIVGIPTSDDTRALAGAQRIPLADQHDVPTPDLVIDGADQIDADLRLIKGGGGALVREKIVARAARAMIVIADERKMVSTLGRGFALPVAVLPFGWHRHADALRSLGTRPELRLGSDGRPVRTDGGLWIIDAAFPDGIDDPDRIEAELEARTGVVACGLFLGLADRALIGTVDGVREMRSSRG